MPNFDFAVCPLYRAAVIRLNLNITGVRIRDREFKLSLYADDVLLRLTNLHITLLNLQAQLRTCGALSGYKVNTSKTETLPINSSIVQE